MEEQTEVIQNNTAKDRSPESRCSENGPAENRSVENAFAGNRSPAGRKQDVHVPGILLAAPASGSGKTAVSCALMAAFQKKGLAVKACKCGPDYIDPMFHREVLGVDSENLDLFFADEDILQKSYARHGEGADLVITEGVMGYYDGMSLDSAEASSYHVARTLKLPVILVVPGRGAALSLAAVIKGMVEYRRDSGIQGILLNQVSAGLYPRLKEMLERELKSSGHPIPVLGYIPRDPAFCFESRHLGLVTPEETDGLKEQIRKAGDILSETVDLDQILQIAESAVMQEEERTDRWGGRDRPESRKQPDGPCIAVARDRAFCFYYKDNLELLKELGCRLVFFSPLSDRQLPEADGIILGGGYPELDAGDLSSNRSMRDSIRRAIEKGIPCLAECGGFLYLHETLQDENGRDWPMAGIIRGKAFPTGRLSRFGYVEISRREDAGPGTAADSWLAPGEKIRGHEFHYWDSTDNGSSCTAVKPDGKRSWNCIHAEKNLFAGFPHLYLPSCRKFAERFVGKCRNYQKTLPKGD